LGNSAKKKSSDEKNGRKEKREEELKYTKRGRRSDAFWYIIIMIKKA
jgi:hypothetical protein